MTLVRRSWRAVIAVALWGSSASAVWWSWDRGRPFREEIQLRLDVKVEAAPLVGRLVWQPRLAHLAPMIIGALIIGLWPRVSDRLSFGWSSLLAAVLTGSFAVALAATDGFDRIMDPVVDKTEYWVNLPRLPSIPRTIASWSDVQFLLSYTTHLKGHPPGFIVLLQALDEFGLGRPWVTAAISWLSLAAITPGIMLVIGQLTDEQVARRVAPFLAVAPFAVWTATSADAFFACLVVWGCALIVMSLRIARLPVGVFLGTLAGVVLSGAVFSTYGAAVAMVIPVVLVLGARSESWKRRAVTALCGGAGAVAVAGAFWAAGFWWFDGLATTKKFYVWGTAQFRPQQYFVVANLAVLVIALGPAFVAGLGGLRAPRLWVIVGPALVAVAAADLSGYSKAEVERIWLPFMPFLMCTTVTLRHPRRWLALQLGLAVTLQIWLRTRG